MPHPDPHAPPDRTPIQIGEVWENPMTGERATILELPHQNPERRVVAELLALVGARVVGEHRHPALVEHFTVRERSGEDHFLDPAGARRLHLGRHHHTLPIYESRIASASV